jgi:3-oxoacyl-[acyl-carrier protein] reductase
LRELDFTGKVALVIGGSSGIGNGIAQAFRHRGALVHVSGTRSSVESYANEEGSDLTGLRYAQFDVSDEAAIAAWPVVFDKLDILVLSQGAVIYQRREFTPTAFNSVVNINLNSIMACAAKYREALSKARGTLITISSVGGLRVTRGNPAYAASKAGVIHLTRTLADAWSAAGIRVNGIAPGLVATKMTRVTTEHPQRLAERLAGIPLKRLGTVDEIAGVALFLASPLASYVVGQTIVVDGGRSLA